MHLPSVTHRLLIAAALLADEMLRLALLSSEAAPALLPALRALAGSCAAALAARLQPEAGGGAAAMEPDLAAQLALPAASVAARLALHLQLTSALVASASSHGADAKQAASGELGRAEAAHAALEEPAAEHMWSSVGQDALAEGVERAGQLLGALRGADWRACGVLVLEKVRRIPLGAL
jgi:hypothetical protein